MPGEITPDCTVHQNGGDKPNTFTREELEQAIKEYNEERQV